MFSTKNVRQTALVWGTLCLLWTLIVPTIQAQKLKKTTKKVVLTAPEPPAPPVVRLSWADSVLAKLSVDQKIGQLLMPRANFKAEYNPTQLKEWISQYHIGGLVFFAGHPKQQAALVNELQAASPVPLLIGMDLEWGLAMRLDSTTRFPYQMTLGAMPDNLELIEEMGHEVGRQCRRLGVHINYAPCVDVNNNPNNPVINFRSFGENPQMVADKALAYMKGMDQERILTSIKHFPGHGDTGTDSHYDLPLIQRGVVSFS
jgi:beta-N-acetylhexosaminidase